MSALTGNCFRVVSSSNWRFEFVVARNQWRNSSKHQVTSNSFPLYLLHCLANVFLYLSEFPVQPQTVPQVLMRALFDQGHHLFQSTILNKNAHRAVDSTLPPVGMQFWPFINKTSVLQFLFKACNEWKLAASKILPLLLLVQTRWFFETRVPPASSFSS